VTKEIHNLKKQKKGDLSKLLSSFTIFNIFQYLAPEKISKWKKTKEKKPITITN
jgi:hypothetical protein